MMVDRGRETHTVHSIVGRYPWTVQRHGKGSAGWCELRMRLPSQKTQVPRVGRLAANRWRARLSRAHVPKHPSTQVPAYPTSNCTVVLRHVPSMCHPIRHPSIPKMPCGMRPAACPSFPSWAPMISPFHSRPKRTAQRAPDAAWMPKTQTHTHTHARTLTAS